MSLYELWMHSWERRLTLRDRNRRIFPFEWGTEWLQDNGQPPDGPLAFLKRQAAEAVRNSDEFFSAPSLHSVQLEGSRLRFPSPVSTPDPSNNVASVRLFEARDSSRAVIVLPQWNAAAGSHVGLCRILQRLGVTAARMTLPYHEERLPPGMRRADYMVSPNIGRTVHAARQAVLEVRQLVDWLSSRGYRQVAVTGTSLGSCIAYLSFVHEPRLCSGVFTHVSAYYADVVWEGLSTRYVRWGLQGFVSLEDLRLCWAPISPWFFIDRLKARYRPHLLIAARYDLTFPPALSQKVFDRYRELELPCDRRWLPCGHYTTGNFPFRYLVGWQICRYLMRQLDDADGGPRKG